MLRIIALVVAVKQCRKLGLHIDHSLRRRLLYKGTQFVKRILVSPALSEQQYAIMPLIKSSNRLRLTQGAQLSCRSFGLSACGHFKVKFVENIAGLALVD